MFKLVINFLSLLSCKQHTCLDLQNNTKELGKYRLGLFNKNIARGLYLWFNLPNVNYEWPRYFDRAKVA